MKWRTPAAFAATLLVLGGGLLAGRQAAVAAYQAGRDEWAALDGLARAITAIERAWVEPVEVSELVHAALQGIADHLDPHTHYFDPEAWARVQDRRADSYEGIGVEVIGTGEALRVVGVVPGGPAALAGLQVGDRILAVDGQPVEGLSLEQAIALVRGERGTAVRLLVDRDGTRREIEVVRDRVVQRSVTGERLDDGVIYARIASFRHGASAELDDLLARLASDGPPTGVVLDLRQDPGGRLEEAVAVADRFLDSGLIVRTEGRLPAADERHEATASPDDLLEVPLVVLVDGGSASASEIVAGALSAHHRATLVGQRTYGKGSVQTVYELDDGGALQLTIARYILPGDVVIEETGGLVPDVVQSLRPPDPAAVALEQALEGAGLTEDQRQAVLRALEEARPPPKPTFDGPVAERARTDLQLRKALELLRP